MVHGTRLKVVSSFTLLCLLGFPIWYYTMTVPRAPLPHRAIDALHRASSFDEKWPLAVNVLLVDQAPECRVSSDALERLLNPLQSYAPTHARAAQLTHRPNSDSNSSEHRSSGSATGAHYNTNIAVRVERVDGAIGLSLRATPSDVDQTLLDYLHTRPQLTGNNVYNVFALPNGVIEAPTWGVHRHAAFSLSACSTDSVSDNVGALIDGYVTPLAKRTHATDRAVKRQVAMKSVPQYQLSFTLLSADPMSAVVDWDFRACHQAYLAPFLRAAARVADFVVHSQVLHHAPLIETPPRDAASGEHWLPTDTLQRYVDPNAWRLAGIDANATTIHLVLFVPPADVPLRVRDANGVPSATNSFIVPQWGGVVVHNVPGAAAQQVASTGQPAQLRLTATDLAPEMTVFVEQLKQLLGLPTPLRVPPPTRPRVLAARSGIAQWQTDWIVRAHLYENLVTSTTALHSLSLLVESLTTMKVLEHIQVLLERSLVALEHSYAMLGRGDIDAAFEHSKRALSDSEEAFFDSEMLALLYYPIEHDLALYLSFYLPMSLPFLSSFYNEYKRRRQRRAEAAAAAAAATAKKEE